MAFLKDLKDKILAPDDDEEEYEEYEEENTSDYEETKNSTVKSNPNAKMVVKEPKSFEDATDIARFLIRKKAVVVNIHRLNEANAIRLLDFLSGVTFAINGSSQKIDKNVFLFAPYEMPVDGSIDEEQY